MAGYQTQKPEVQSKGNATPIKLCSTWILGRMKQHLCLWSVQLLNNNSCKHITSASVQPSRTKLPRISTTSKPCRTKKSSSSALQGIQRTSSEFWPLHPLYSLGVKDRGLLFYFSFSNSFFLKVQVLKTFCWFHMFSYELQSSLSRNAELWSSTSLWTGWQSLIYIFVYIVSLKKHWENVIVFTCMTSFLT